MSTAITTPPSTPVSIGTAPVIPDLDELAAELSEFAAPEAKGGRPPRDERVIAGFEEVQRFVEKHGRAPQHGEDLDIFERLYAVRLDRLRALEECRSVLASLDHQGLLAGTPLREVPEAKVTDPAGATDAARPRPRRAPKAAEAEVLAVEDDPSGTDVVNEIFARLRKATLEERGASAHVPKKAAAPKQASPTGELFARRDAAVEEPLAVLTRKVKRALQDDQNVMLERLRDVKGMITTELEDEHAQRARYGEAAVDALGDAAAAGARFAFDEAGVSGPPVSRAALHDCAADLAVTIVLALRKRILTDGAGDGVERANTAYKEWRGARVERLCTDAARRAFHLGVLTAAQGRAVRFYAAPNDAPCDACALDARAGERLAGASFPSGSAQPPLHAGCACAVVPV